MLTLHRAASHTLFFILLASLARADAPNLIANGDFSAISKNQPDSWSISGDEKSVTQKLTVKRDTDGTAYAELACTRFERSGPSAHAMLAQVGKVHLTKGRTYEFSCRMRQQGLAGRSVSVAIQDTRAWKNAGLSTQFPVSDVWRTCRRVFVATEDVGDKSRLQIWYTEMGTLCVADVKIVECKAEEVTFTHQVLPTASKNRVPNGSFETGSPGWSSLGTGVGWGDLAQLHGTIENGGAAHGRSFLRIPMGEGRTPMVYFDYYDPIAKPELRPLAANLGWIPVETGIKYTLSCSMRASRDGMRAMLGVQYRDPSGSPRIQQKDVTLTTAWKRYEFTTTAQQRFAFIFAGPSLEKDERVDVDVDAIQFEKADIASEFAPHEDVEWSIEPAQAGGIFTDDQPARLILRAANFGDTRQALTVALKASDFEDKPIALPDVQMSLAPKSNTEKRIDLPADWRGYYLIAASGQAGERRTHSNVRLAIVPRPAADSVCGINHAFTTADMIRAASKAGVAWYRDWSLKMQHIEPKRGEYRWDLSDTQIDRVLKEGRQVLPLMPPFPSADWCSETPDSLPTKGYPWNRMRSAFAPKDPADLTNFIEQSVSRYKDRIHIWEFLNEPVYTDYALPSDKQDKYGGKKYSAADYVALLEKAAAAMRKADPSCKVMGGIAGWPRMLTRDVIDAGILKHIDLFNLHMYPSHRLPEAFLGDMDYLLGLMDAAGGRKPIWVTEFSYYAADDLPRKPFIPRPNSWSEERLLESERQCADYTVRFFLVMLMRNVEKVFIHSGASGRVNDPNFECAIFAQGMAPRKLFASLAVLTKVLGPKPAFAGEAKLGQTGHCAAFETGASSVLVFWQSSDQPGPAIDLALPSEAKWINPMGQTLASAPNLSPSPAYVIAPPGQAKALIATVRDRAIK